MCNKDADSPYTGWHVIHGENGKVRIYCYYTYPQYKHGNS